VAHGYAAFQPPALSRCRKRNCGARRKAATAQQRHRLEAHRRPSRNATRHTHCKHARGFGRLDPPLRQIAHRRRV
jgi:hypothetical protein